MKRILLIFTFLLLPLGGGLSVAQDKGPDPSVGQALEKARQMADQLADQVRGVLFEELKKGGYPGAVQACSELAQEITRQFNTQPGHLIRRVSLKYRSPRDIPDDYEKGKLEEFDRLQQERRLPPEIFEIQRVGHQPLLRYMKPLITLPMCLPCHGPREKIPEEVKGILERKYPHDRATEYRTGDVRGAISVLISLP